MRGYFGIGVEGISKPANMGTVIRSAHAFGASFFYNINPACDIPDDIREIKVSDTADSFDHLPYFEYESVNDLQTPKGCQIVAIELVDESINLPSFRHPTRALYVLGPEMGNVSDQMLERADHVIKIPTKFCINVGVAGAIVMYDRAISMGHYNDGQFADRPVKAGGPAKPFKNKEFGNRRKIRNLILNQS